MGAKELQNAPDFTRLKVFLTTYHNTFKVMLCAQGAIMIESGNSTQVFWPSEIVTHLDHLIYR